MPAHESVTEMVSAYAQQAVQQALAMHATLDYSENSLIELEVILSQLAGRVGDAAAEEVGEMCKTWGSYFGEVVRRRFGGDWSIETYPGKQFATLTLSIGGNKLFPTIKVHRRLTEGQDDNIWSFYKMVKAKLESLAGPKIQ